MKTHELKTWPAWFELVASHAKTFEVRRDDREFEQGDRVNLREYDPVTHEYSGREAHGMIGFVLRGAMGIEPGYCVMSVFVMHIAIAPAWKVV